MLQGCKASGQTREQEQNCIITRVKNVLPLNILNQTFPPRNENTSCLRSTSLSLVQ